MRTLLGGRRAAISLGLAVACLGLQGGGPVRAATPSGPLTLTVPSTGTASINWTGTVVPGTNAAALRCLAAVNVLTDDQTFHLVGASPSFYATHRVLLVVRVSWTPATTGATNDLALTTYLDDGNGNLSDFRDSGALGTTYQVAEYVDPSAAIGSTVYHAGVCPQANATPQAYRASATVTVSPATATRNVRVGSERFVNYPTPPGYQTRDTLQRTNGGEPSIGADWKTGAVMYQSGTQVSRVTFDDRRAPAIAHWTDVTPAQLKPISEDSILAVDPRTSRTFSSELLVACSAMSYSDNDGSSWLPSTGCPLPHSPDHQTVGGGPYARGGSSINGYPDAVYYCSQNVVQATGAFCGVSHDGGTSFGPSKLVFGPGTPCNAIHGHIRVAPDGTAYLPQRQCYAGSGSSTRIGQGMALTRDNGSSWQYSAVPDSTTHGMTSSDPSVVAAADNTVYYAYEDAFGGASVAVSTNHGASWSPSASVSAPFGIHNTKFPEVIAGDGDRAAVAFLGTTTAGDDQQQSTGPTPFAGTWNLFVSFTYDRGRTWSTVNATPNDPVQRGCIWMAGGSSECRNMLDFNEITVDRYGRVLVAYTDGCTNTCETDPQIHVSGCNGGKSENDSPTSTPTCSYARLSSLVRQSCGRGLFARYDSVLTRSCSGPASTAASPPSKPPAGAASGTVSAAMAAMPGARGERDGGDEGDAGVADADAAVEGHGTFIGAAAGAGSGLILALGVGWWWQRRRRAATRA